MMDRTDIYIIIYYIYISFSDTPDNSMEEMYTIIIIYTLFSYHHSSVIHYSYYSAMCQYQPLQLVVSYHSRVLGHNVGM